MELMESPMKATQLNVTGFWEVMRCQGDEPGIFKV